MKQYFKRLNDHPGLGISVLVTILSILICSHPQERWYYSWQFGLITSTTIWAIVLISNIKKKEKQPDNTLTYYILLSDKVNSILSAALTYLSLDELKSLRDRLNSRLPPAEVWYNTDEKQPLPQQPVLFVVESSDPNYNGKQYGGKYIGFNYGYHEFALPGISFSAKIWRPMPTYEQ